MQKFTYLFYAFLCSSPVLSAASFVAPPSTGAQTLNAGETGSVLVNGVISTDNNAITIAGNNANLLNLGLIETTITGEVIYVNTANNVQITNKGLITTVDDYVIQIVDSTDCQINNMGTVGSLTRGNEYCFAIGSSPGTQIINSGQILSPYGYTIYTTAGCSDFQIINTGLIQSAESPVIDISGSDNFDLINSGTIKSTGGAFLAIGGSLNPTLTLLRGSNLQGALYVDNTSPLNLNVQKGLNVALTMDGGGSFNTATIQAPFVVTGDPVIGIIDPTGFTLQADITADISDAIFEGIYMHRSRQCQYGGWIVDIGSYRYRDGSRHAVSYNDWQVGGLVGYDAKLWNAPLSFFGGASYVQSDVNHHTQRAQVVQASLGLSYENCLKGTFLGVSAVGGYIHWDNKRYVLNNLAPGGIEAARVNMNRGFFTADLALARAFDCFLNPRVAFNLRYAGLYLGDYAEKGSLTNLSVFKRSVDLITTRLETALSNIRYLEPFIGIFGRYQVSGKQVKGELLGANLNFDQPGQKNLGAVFVGIRASSSFNLVTTFLDCEVSYDTGKSVRVLGKGGVRF